MLPQMNSKEIQIAQTIEQKIKDLPQLSLVTHHTLHDGVYYRGVYLNKGEAIVGTVIKIPTTLILTGRIQVYIGNRSIEVMGMQIIPAAANRKQVMYAQEDSTVTMCFKTTAKTVEEAEEEFTDEYSNLMSRQPQSVNITNIGELICQQ